MRYILCGINAKYIHSNLAIFSLRAYAARYIPRESSLKIKEYTINQYVDYILQDLYEEHADVLIFSCYIWNITYVKELACELKKICPLCKIWVGGPEVSYDPEVFLRENPSVDLVMRGEGEAVFTDLILRCEAREPYAFVPGIPAHTAAAVHNILGITYRSGQRILDGGFAPLMDLDQIPFAYEDFDPFTHKILYYESSRGCPFSCSYCLSSIDKSVRFRSLDTVKKELQTFLDAGVTQVKFVDRTFNCKKTHAMSIWTYLTEHDNGVTNFHFEIAGDLLDDEEIALLKKMRPGLIQLEIGVQSTNTAVIEAIHRKMNLERVFANADAVHHLGNIHQHMDLIAGLPGENLESFRKSFNDLYRHRPDQLQLGFLKVLKGTVMESQIKEFDLQYRSQPPYEVLSTKWLDFSALHELKRVEEVVELYYNSGQYDNTLRYIMPRFADPYTFYEQFSAYFHAKDYHSRNHNRLKKYEILRDFLQDACKLSLPWLEQMMLLDLYLRENIKSRPSWAGKASLPPALQGRLIREKKGGYRHIERFSFQVSLWKEEEKIEPASVYVLFDYQNRDPLNQNARITVIDQNF